MQEAAGGQAQSPGAHRQPELLGGQREEEEGRLSWGAQGWRVEWVYGQSQAISVRLGLG